MVINELLSSQLVINRFLIVGLWECYSEPFNQGWVKAFLRIFFVKAPLAEIIDPIAYSFDQLGSSKKLYNWYPDKPQG
jgi:hypothetical protein